MIVLYNVLPQLRDKLCQFHKRGITARYCNKTFDSCDLWTRPLHKNLPLPSPSTTNYSFQTWRLATCDVKASRPTSTLHAHDVTENAQFKTRLQQPYLCTHDYFFQNFPISPTFALSPYLNSRYLKNASSKINCHVLTKLIRLPAAHNSCFNHRTESSTFTVETHLHLAFAND
jgi:hypothetical protein